MNTGIISRIIANDGLLHHLVNGEREAALEKIREDLVRKTWLVRILGTVAIVIGFLVLFGAFMTLLRRIPLIGGLVDIGVTAIATVLGLSLSLIVILASLVFHHPLTVALPLALVVAAVVWFVRSSRSAGRNAQRVLARKIAGRREVGLEPAPPPSSPLDALPPPPEPISAASRSELIEQTFTNLVLLAMTEGELHRRERRFLTSWGEENGNLRSADEAIAR